MLRIDMRLAVLIAAVVAPATAVRAANDADVLARYVTDDVLAVVSVDLTKLDLLAWFEHMADLGVVPESLVEAERQSATQAQEGYEELVKLGARRASVLLRTSDIHFGGTTWVIELADEAEGPRVVKLLEAWLEKAREERSFGSDSSMLPSHLEATGNIVLAASSAEQLAMLNAGREGAPRDDARAALKALLAADAGFVAFGDADSRRVLREMLPAAPAPFMEINGRLLADGVRWGGLLIKLPPDASATVTIEGASPETIATIEQAAAKGLELLKALCLAEMVNGPPDHKARAAALLPLVPLLAPTIDGTRLSLTFGDDQAEVDAVRNLLLPAVASAREAAWRSQRMNNFKQIAIALLNYESAKKSFPAAASYDEDGRPLLSWRVHILPFMEEKALYNEFHLDEPWDSDHNRRLIERMPALFADPDPAVQREIGGVGRTTTVVPVGAGTVFDGRNGFMYRDIDDGTSNTVLFVQVIPERAVVWTKPEDWEVDFTDALWGVSPPDDGSGGTFAAAYCDGSVRQINANIDAQVWAALLTADGREDIPAY
jgi:hypothetical protein